MKTFRTEQSNLLKYSGMKCEIIEECEAVEYRGSKLGKMCTVRFESGDTIDAFEYELE